MGERTVKWNTYQAMKRRATRAELRAQRAEDALRGRDIRYPHLSGLEGERADQESRQRAGGDNYGG